MGVDVGVLVGVEVLVGVRVLVGVGVLVGVDVAVGVTTDVGVLVGVEVGQGEADDPVTNGKKTGPAIKTIDNKTGTTIQRGNIEDLPTHPQLTAAGQYVCKLARCAQPSTPQAQFIVVAHYAIPYQPIRQ